jgi:DNA-binding XRE family transcriptional regulator
LKNPPEIGTSQNDEPKPPTNKPFKKRFRSRPSGAAGILSINVKRLRKDLDLSQAELAKKVGVDQAAIGLVELKRANPTLQTIAALAKALKTNVADLFSKPVARRLHK